MSRDVESGVEWLNQKFGRQCYEASDMVDRRDAIEIMTSVSSSICFSATEK